MLQHGKKRNNDICEIHPTINVARFSRRSPGCYALPLQDDALFVEIRTASTDSEDGGIYLFREGKEFIQPSPHHVRCPSLSLSYTPYERAHGAADFSARSP